MSRPLTQEQALAAVAAKESRAQSACRPYLFRDHRTVAELPKAETRRKQRATPGLTAKQDELLALLRAKEAAGERTPSYQELTDLLGLNSKSGVFRLLDALEERGFIARISNRARSITLVEQQPAAMLLNFSDRDLIREIEWRGYRVQVIR